MVKMKPAILILCLVACNTEARSDGGEGGDDGTTGASGQTGSVYAASTGTAGTFESDFPPAECKIDEQGTAPTPTVDAFKQQLVGRWLLCGTTSIFGSGKVYERGIELVGDGSWYKIHEPLPGVFERQFGFDDQGTWEVLGEDPFQLNLTVAGGGTRFVRAEFSITPRKMLLADASVTALFVWRP